MGGAEWNTSVGYQPCQHFFLFPPLPKQSEWGWLKRWKSTNLYFDALLANQLGNFTANLQRKGSTYSSDKIQSGRPNVNESKVIFQHPHNIAAFSMNWKHFVQWTLAATAPYTFNVWILKWCYCEKLTFSAIFVLLARQLTHQVRKIDLGVSRWAGFVQVAGLKHTVLILLNFLRQQPT